MMMSYEAEISRANPTLFILLVDQSASMVDAIGDGSGKRKSDVVADAINRLLAELAVKCAKEEGVRDYFYVSVLGYGAAVAPVLGGTLDGCDLIPLSQVANSPARIEERSKKVPDGAGGLVQQCVKFPVWLDATARGGTPMTQALSRAEAVVSNWLSDHPGCFPPVVLNLTDGEATDGDPLPAAERLRALNSSDGNVLLFNLHVSSDRSPSVTFPDSSAGLPNRPAETLFHMSSNLPSHMQHYAQHLGYATSEGTVGFVFNADATAIVQFLEIGTRATDLR